MIERGFIVAGARILKRAWQIYVAHVFLFAIYIAEIAYVASSFENPLYVEEMNALDFLKTPDVTIIQALLLKFKPANMDVLPLYIVLLMMFPPVLWLLIRNATVALALSVALYVLTWEFGWNIAVLAERALVLQSVRLAASVRVRRLVRARRRDAAGAGACARRSRCGSRSPICVFAFGVTHDLVFPAARLSRPALARRMDVSDRQDQSRRAALCAFPGAGGADGALHSARLAGAAIAVAAAGDPVRAAFAGNLLPRRVPGLRRAFRDGRVLRRHRDAGADQHGRHPDYGWHSAG